MSRITYSYLRDQDVVMSEQYTSWSRALTVADLSKPVVIALVWTDRAGAGLKNDLRLQAQVFRTQFYGNDFSNGYSIPRVRCDNCGQPIPDHTNNVEKIVINPSDLPDSSITVKVIVEGLTTNGIEIGPTTPLQQDFAVVVLNARVGC